MSKENIEACMSMVLLFMEVPMSQYSKPLK